MGETLQLDDYPYVHFMHVIDDELAIAIKDIKDNQSKLIEIENLKSVKALAGAIAHVV